MANVKPFVQVACVCENALLEPDGVISLIRVVDTFNLHIPENPPPGTKFAVSLNVVVTLKSGDVVGDYEIGLVLRQPNLLEPELGLYWFDVVWKNETLTSIPFRLKRAEPESKPLIPS